jgi:hypothetical protein
MRRDKEEKEMLPETKESQGLEIEGGSEISLLISWVNKTNS